jgi:hypothetical protein
MASSASVSTPSSILSSTPRADGQTITKIAAEMSSPTIGSASGKPAWIPMAPASTARLVQPSTRAWYPSAISAALPIWRPTRMRKTATASFPMNPITDATITAQR